jgi:hypothetical protein
MSMSNQERISWVALVINVVIGYWYFSRILALPADADLFGPLTAAFAAKLVMLAVLVGIASEILLHIVQKSTGGGGDAAAEDERDALISLKATRNAHGVLGFAVVVVLVQIALLEWGSRSRYWSWRYEPETVLGLLGTGPLQSMHVAQLLLAALGLAAIALNASRVFYYRRGY